jgi:pyruvate/2-oxoglutarate dehydrogenase complex dihydrolipoamide acyltransferase (E2) component
MAIEIKMPALSPTMTTGTLAKWLVGEGDRVNSGDVIAEIETDKATMEVESVDDGVMAKIFVDAGTENVAVGAVIAVLAEDGETASDVAKAGLQEPSSPVPVTSVAAEAKDRAEPAPVTAAPVKAVPAPKPKAATSREYLPARWRAGLRLIGILRLRALPEAAPMAGFYAVMLNLPPPPQSRRQPQH